MPPPIPPDSQFWGISLLDLKDMVSRSLVSLVALLFSLSALPSLSLPTTENLRASDPCAAIAGQKWVAPADVRACFTSFQVDPVEKANVGGNHNMPLFPFSPTNLFSNY